MELVTDELHIELSDFHDSNWLKAITSTSKTDYMNLCLTFSHEANEALAAGHINQYKVLYLLSKACSMNLVPSCYNEPFRPMAFVAEPPASESFSFTSEDLNFFAKILDSVSDTMLLARLADILWVLQTPKNFDHALLAIESYTNETISGKTGLYVLKRWERGTRLAQALKRSDTVNDISQKLLEAFNQEYEDDIGLVNRIGQLIFDLKLLPDLQEDIATRLYLQGHQVSDSQEFNDGRHLFFGRHYFELAHQFFKDIKDYIGAYDCLFDIAENYEKEAQYRITGNHPSAFAANAFYQHAIRVYRRIPNNDRQRNDVDQCIKNARHKLTETGQQALEGMVEFELPKIDISEEITRAKSHVSGKNTTELALMCFTGLYKGPKVDRLRQECEENLSQATFRRLAGTVTVHNDGRIIDSTPALGVTHKSDEKIIKNEMIENFTNFMIPLVVKGSLLPALDTILQEHTITEYLLCSTCHQSPFVPKGRENLIAKAIWFGFERDFATSIHLLTPQLEHIIRTHLKACKAHTTHLDDKNRTETENSLSTLLDLPGAKQLFGEDYLFEFKALLTSVNGPNLRNEVAHGLLNDENSSTLITVYVWWLTLRWVIWSIITPEILSINNTDQNDSPA